LVTLSGVEAAALCRKFFKISSLDLMHLKTFRTAVVAKLIFSNRKMAVPAAQPVFLNWCQHQDLVVARIHVVVYSVLYVFIYSENETRGNGDDALQYPAAGLD